MLKNTWKRESKWLYNTHFSLPPLLRLLPSLAIAGDHRLLYRRLHRNHRRPSDLSHDSYRADDHRNTSAASNLKFPHSHRSSRSRPDTPKPYLWYQNNPRAILFP
ncbi:hypothetical protein GUJ93_ZPchr0004g38360 [Zizania palustris]|uniref:Uncharacterized protein n=1 Tax=Zizania palustris TaxID=103762 RepID=A0A8J5VZI0_ZIZPA|nr:hypothetical protein GUJ93_ZPchr0004g38360 [Zizania palustris]